jgi:hypothetical protein
MTGGALSDFDLSVSVARRRSGERVARKPNVHDGTRSGGRGTARQRASPEGVGGTLQTDVSLLRWTAAACLASSAPPAVDGQSWRRILWLFSFKKIREWAEKLQKII